MIGIVDAIGAGVQGWRVGARAGVGWFGGSCGYCRHCRRDNAFVCENVQEISGVTRDGGYATHMIARASAVAHVPDDLDVVESAPLLCAGVTTFNALRHTGAGPGDIVAVHGVGRSRASRNPICGAAGLSHGRSQPRPRQGRARAATRRKRLHRQRSGGPRQGADRDGRRESHPRHRHRRQGHAGDLRRARAERGHDGDRRRRASDGEFVRSPRQARLDQGLVFGHRAGFRGHARLLQAATASPR